MATDPASQPPEQPQSTTNNNLDNLQFDAKQLKRNDFLLGSVENQIRMAYMKPGILPMHFCSYAGFTKVFSYPNIQSGFKYQNLNIIDIHLRYHQFIHEKLAIYKWVPSLVVVAATKFHPLGLVFPLVFTRLIDKYFKDFFIWKYSHQKMINIRPEFITKLCKNKNKLRRVIHYDQLKQDLAKNQSQIPNKYIKFGENTKYIFHTTINDIEESSIYLTPMFQNFIKIKTFNTNSVFDFFTHFVELKNEYLTYRKQKKQSEQPLHLNYDKLITFKDIKKQQKYNATKQIEQRIQRWLQLIKYYKTGNFFISGFSIHDVLNLNKQYDLLSPQKYNYQSNYPDLSIFYGIVLTGKIMRFIIKRAVRM